MLSDNDDLIRLVINSIRKDLEDHNEVFNCLALQAIADLGSKEVAESLVGDVYKILVSAYVKETSVKDDDSVEPLSILRERRRLYLFCGVIVAILISYLLPIGQKKSLK